VETGSHLTDTTFRDEIEGIDFSNREDITYKQMHRWMDGVTDSVRRGLQMIAEHGPVIDAQLLREAGINIRRFQTGTTRRTRKISGDPSCYLLAWNHWSDVDDTQGKYAVTPITHQSLRRYFGLLV